MANQGNHGRDKGSQPTWEDVGRMMHWLEQEYGGHVELSVDSEGIRNNAGYFWVYAKMWGDFAPFGKRPVHVARSVWPCIEAKQLSSLAFRLMHSLDHMAEAQRGAEGRGLPF